MPENHPASITTNAFLVGRELVGINVFDSDIPCVSVLRIAAATGNFIEYVEGGRVGANHFAYAIKLVARCGLFVPNFCFGNVVAN